VAEQHRLRLPSASCGKAGWLPPSASSPASWSSAGRPRGRAGRA